MSRRPVDYKLMISAEMKNVYNLQPVGGVDQNHFSYFVELQCLVCYEIREKEVEFRLRFGSADPLKCKQCGHKGSVHMVKGHGQPHNGSESTPLMIFRCTGVKPLSVRFGYDCWQVDTEREVGMIIDLNSGEHQLPDGNIKNFEAKFEKD